jgi:hypothetical protein
MYRGLDVPGPRHFRDAPTHPFQIRVGSQRADIEKLAKDRVRVAGRVGERELNLFVPGFLRQLGDDAEVDITDHVIRQNQKVRRMQIRVENAEPERRPGGSFVMTLLQKTWGSKPMLSRVWPAPPDRCFRPGGDRRKHCALPEIPLVRMRAVVKCQKTFGIRSVGESTALPPNQVAVAGLAAVVELVAGPGHLFANQIPYEVEASHAEQEYQPDEALQQAECRGGTSAGRRPSHFYRDRRAVAKLGFMHLADGGGGHGHVVELG